MTKYARCELCGEVKPCRFGPDPYALDIDDDDTPMWLCDECAEQRAADI